MTFARRLRALLLGSGVLLLSLAPMPAAPQSAASGQASAASDASSASKAPAESRQAYSLPPDKLAKAIALSRIRNILEIAGSLWGIAVLWLLLATGAAARLEAWAQCKSERRWLQGALFFVAFIVITTLASLPLDWYGHYVSRSYGISVQGWGSWSGDQAKGLGVNLVIATLVLLLFNWIVRRWPRRYWFGIWLVTLPLLMLAIFASPLVIDPLFNKFEPLSKNHAPLVAKLETVVSRTGIDIPPDRMYLMKASEKYNGINAYVTGIGASKRYVMWDTATDRLPDDEVLFVFGHESGHYVLHHIPKILAGSAVGLFFLYWACAGCAQWLAGRFGARWGLLTPEVLVEPQTPLATRTGFVVLLLTVSIAGFVLEPLSNGFSRHFEHQADVYGQEAIHGIVADPQQTAVAAFNDLGKAWLDDPNPSPFIEFWLYNHPSTQSRANFALHYDPWANGGRGEFFAK